MKRNEIDPYKNSVVDPRVIRTTIQTMSVVFQVKGSTRSMSLSQRKQGESPVLPTVNPKTAPRPSP